MAAGDTNVGSTPNTVEKIIKKNGVKLQKEDFKNFKKLIKSKGKRIQHKNMFMHQCLVHDLEYNTELEELDFFMLKHKDREDHEEEIVLSARLEYGCVLMVAGAILEFTG